MDNTNTTILSPKTRVVLKLKPQGSKFKPVSGTASVDGNKEEISQEQIEELTGWLRGIDDLSILDENRVSASRGFKNTHKEYSYVKFDPKAMKSVEHNVVVQYHGIPTPDETGYLRVAELDVDNLELSLFIDDINARGSKSNSDEESSDPAEADEAIM